MINVMIRTCFCLLALYFVNITGIAVGSTETPVNIVKKYCEADQNGSRLTSDAYAAVRPLVSWKDEPGWDHSFVITDFDITSSRITKNGEVAVEVRYKVVAIINGDELLSYSFVELVDFVLAKYGKEWKIVQPIVPPHVSVSAVIANIKDVIKSEADKDRVRELKYLIVRLEDIKNKP
jgi:hypothetical protein